MLSQNNKIQYTFSFNEYKEILKIFKNKFSDYSKALVKKKFVILKHDVEFSVSRALEIAKIEYQAGVKSTFFFQVISNAYNPFSITNLKTGEKYKNDEEWKAKGIPKSDIRRDVRIIMPSLDLFGKTK